MLSISFLSDSDSIHRNTRIAGDTMTSTDSQKPTLRSSRRRRAAPGDARRASGLRRRAQVHFVLSRTCSSSSASASTMTKNTTTTADALPML